MIASVPSSLISSETGGVACGAVVITVPTIIAVLFSYSIRTPTPGSRSSVWGISPTAATRIFVVVVI